MSEQLELNLAGRMIQARAIQYHIPHDVILVRILRGKFHDYQLWDPWNGTLKQVEYTRGKQWWEGHPYNLSQHEEILSIMSKRINPKRFFHGDMIPGLKKLKFNKDTDQYTFLHENGYYYQTFEE